MQKQVIKFTNRSPYPNSIFIGNEDDNLARQVQFVLPSEIDGAKIYLHLSIGEYSDVIELDDSLIYVPTRTHTQHPGNWTGYLEAHADNDTVWHSNTFTFKVGDLPDSGEQIEQAYPSAIESALNEIRSLSEKTELNAQQVSKDKQTVEQKISDINASTSKINIVAQTLEPGMTATADASISPKDGIQLNVGIPGGLPGRDGRDGVDGKDGYTPVKGVDYFDGANGLNAPQIDDTKVSAEHPWSGAKVDAELSELRDDLSDLAPAGAAVGQLFRVAAISEDGKYTMEPVDMLDVRINGTSIVADGVANIPFASLGKYGLAMPRSLDYGINSTSDGRFFINPSNISDVNLRKNQYKPIAPYMLDYAVKAAMCDGIGAAWTAEEQAAARERIGIPGNYELIHDETITEDIYQYTIDNISLKKAIVVFYSVPHTSDNYLLVDLTLDAAVNGGCATTKAINKNGFVCYYYAYCEEGVFHNLAVGPVRPNGATTNNLNKFSTLYFAETITAIKLSAYTSSEVIPSGCRIKVYGVRA